jgi:hypothetical protein
MAATGPIPRVDAVRATIRHNIAAMTVAAAGDDGGQRTTQRGRHGSAPVGVAAQFLPVPGREQERVVGPGAEYQYGQDARALSVDRQSGVAGQDVDQGLGHGQGRARRTRWAVATGSGCDRSAAG